MGVLRRIDPTPLSSCIGGEGIERLLAKLQSQGRSRRARSRLTAETTSSDAASNFIPPPLIVPPAVRRWRIEEEKKEEGREGRRRNSADRVTRVPGAAGIFRVGGKKFVILFGLLLFLLKKNSARWG